MVRKIVQGKELSRRMEEDCDNWKDYDKWFEDKKENTNDKTD